MSSFFLAKENLKLRLVEEEDKELISQRIKDEHFNAMTNDVKHWLTKLSYKDLDVFLEKFDSMSTLIINETYLVIYDVSEFWWSKDKVLVDNMILRLNKDGPGNFSDVMKAFDVLAEINDCKYIDVGTALNKNMNLLNDKFMKYGYEPGQYNLIKTVR